MARGRPHVAPARPLPCRRALKIAMGAQKAHEAIPHQQQPEEGCREFREDNAFERHLTARHEANQHRQQCRVAQHQAGLRPALLHQRPEQAFADMSRQSFKQQHQEIKARDLDPGSQVQCRHEAGDQHIKRQRPQKQQTGRLRHELPHETAQFLAARVYPEFGQIARRKPDDAEAGDGDGKFHARHERDIDTVLLDGQQAHHP